MMDEGSGMGGKFGFGLGDVVGENHRPYEPTNRALIRSESCAGGLIMGLIFTYVNFDQNNYHYKRLRSIEIRKRYLLLAQRFDAGLVSSSGGN